MPRSLARRIVLVLGAVFLFGPLVLYAAGVTDRAVENRPLSGRPRLSEGWGAFDQATRYLVDRLPLRGSAVRANTWIAEHVFHQTPHYGGVGVGGEQATTALPFGAPRQDRPAREPAQPVVVQSGGGVLPGRDGWLYLKDDYYYGCHPKQPLAQAVARWAHLVRAVRATGRRAFVYFMPDKSTVYPEHLPASVPEAACAAPNRRLLWRLLEHHPPPGLIGMRQAELALKAREHPTLTYYRRDSHPNTLGALLLLRAIVRRLDVPLLPGEDARGPDRKVTGDLTIQLGTPTKEIAPGEDLKRRGIGPITTGKVKLPSGQLASSYTLAPGPRPRIPGRTVLVGDSFATEIERPLAQFAAQLTRVTWNYSSGDDLGAALASADTVVIEVAERLASVWGPPDAQIDALAARLGRPPG